MIYVLWTLAALASITLYAIIGRLCVVGYCLKVAKGKGSKWERERKIERFLDYNSGPLLLFWPLFVPFWLVWAAISMPFDWVVKNTKRYTVDAVDHLEEAERRKQEEIDAKLKAKQSPHKVGALSVSHDDGSGHLSVAERVWGPPVDNKVAKELGASGFYGDPADLLHEMKKKVGGGRQNG